VRQHQEVDDVPAQRPGLAEDPVGQVAGDAASSRPSATAQRGADRRLSQSTTQTAAIATQVKTTVNSVPVLNAAPGCGQVQDEPVAEHSMSPSAGARRPSAW
jgi:hypothetical protein